MYAHDSDGMYAVMGLSARPKKKAKMIKARPKKKARKQKSASLLPPPGQGLKIAWDDPRVWHGRPGTIPPTAPLTPEERARHLDQKVLLPVTLTPEERAKYLDYKVLQEPQRPRINGAGPIRKEGPGVVPSPSTPSWTIIALIAAVALMFGRSMARGRS